MNNDFSLVEEQLLELATPHIKEMCHQRWCNLEPEDRLAEAFFLFIMALRNFPLNSGHFIEDYDKALEEHMSKLNRKTPSLRYSHISLDSFPGEEKDTGCNLYHVLPSKEPDYSYLNVESFLKTLTPLEQDIAQELMTSKSKAKVAQKHGFTAYQLKKIVTQIGKQYIQWSTEK